MSYESQAEKELLGIVEAFIYVDPIVHTSWTDDTDGDRATVFEMVGMNNQPNFTLESVGKSLLFSSWGTQYAYVDEVNGVVNTKWISETVKAFHRRDDFQEAVEVTAS